MLERRRAFHATMKFVTRYSVQRFKFRTVTFTEWPHDYKFNHNQQLGYWYFTSALRENPYSVLNIPVNSNYETVKAAFIKAALKHHPDRSRSSNCTAAFLRIRQALEEITSTQNSSNNSSKSDEQTVNHPKWERDAEFYECFKGTTGEYLTFEMNHQTRQEVIHASRHMSRGGLDKGGHWEMARMITEREDNFHQNGGRNSVDSDDKLQLGQSTTTSDPLRRKRNW